METDINLYRLWLILTQLLNTQFRTCFSELWYKKHSYYFSSFEKITISCLYYTPCNFVNIFCMFIYFRSQINDQQLHSNICSNNLCRATSLALSKDDNSGSNVSFSQVRLNLIRIKNKLNYKKCSLLSWWNTLTYFTVITSFGKNVFL